jgi:hypothetical protein
MKQGLQSQVHGGDLFSINFSLTRRWPTLILVGFVAGQGVTLRYVLLAHTRVMEIYQQTILWINSLGSLPLRAATCQPSENVRLKQWLISKSKLKLLSNNSALIGTTHVNTATV